GQFSRKGFKFLFVHRLPVSVVGVNISKTGNYTILITVSHLKYQANTISGRRVLSFLALAKNVIRHTPNILKTLSLDKPLHNLQQRYSDMIFIY
ncbi:IS4 family transposase, partial [Escherichia coli]